MRLPRFFSSVPLARRVSSTLVLLVALAGLESGGCAASPAATKISLFVQHAPVPTLVPRGDVVRAAQRVADLTEGDFVLRGAGRSMEPIYHAGTVVVVHPSAMHMLRKGMAVVYRNQSGTHVAHMLLEKTEQGWVAIGLNNTDPDGVLVTSKNLVGIIQYAFAADS